MTTGAEPSPATTLAASPAAAATAAHGDEPAVAADALMPVFRLCLPDIATGSLDALRPSSWLAYRPGDEALAEFDANDGRLLAIHDEAFAGLLAQGRSQLQEAAGGAVALLVVDSLHVRALWSGAAVDVGADADADAGAGVDGLAEEETFVVIGKAFPPLSEGKRYSAPEFLQALAGLARSMQDATPNSIG